MDCWFAAKENFEFIVKKNKHFVAALKNNRLVALSLDDKKQGRFVKVSELDLKMKHKTNHFALRAKFLIRGNSTGLC
jgi:hypothetical protein